MGPLPRAADSVGGAARPTGAPSSADGAGASVGGAGGAAVAWLGAAAGLTSGGALGCAFAAAANTKTVPASILETSVRRLRFRALMGERSRPSRRAPAAEATAVASRGRRRNRGLG